MTTLAAPDEKAAVQAGAPASPQWRVRRAGGAERIVEVRGGKCTIGSSSRCHVCLPSAEAKPLQCLVSLGAEAATITRWAAGVLLNGREFAKETLRAGDRISIGAWELEWDEPAPEDQVEFESVESDRATIDYTPPSLIAADAPPVQPATDDELSASPSIRQTDPWPMPLAAAPAVRPAAKTELVASRRTDPLAAAPTPSQAAPVVAEPIVAPVAPPVLSHVAFEDRLVLRFWSRAESARGRAKNLAVAVRAARGRIADLEASTSLLDGQLKAAHATHQIETKTLAEAVEAARCEAGELRERLAAGERELAAVQEQMASLEAAPALAQDTSDADAARCDVEQQLAALERQQSQWLAELQSLERDRAAELAAVAAERNALQQQLDELAAAANCSAVSTATLEEPTWPGSRATETLAEYIDESPGFDDAPSLPMVSTADVEPMPLEEPAQPSPTTLWSAPVEEQAIAPEPPATPLVQAIDFLKATPPTPQAEPAPALAPAPTSFIEKYRHLLEDGGDAEPSPRLSHPILDDEYLSPSKCARRQRPMRIRTRRSKRTCRT